MTDAADPIVDGNAGSINRAKMDPRRRLVDLARGPKRVILVVNDFLLLSFALWLALSLRLSVFYLPRSLDLAAILAAAQTHGAPIRRIVLTHAHMDHVASLDALHAARSEERRVGKECA